MLRKPTIKTLSQCFDDPKAARRIFEMPRAVLLDRPECRALHNAMLHSPKTWQLRMTALNACGSFHGLESIETVAQDSRGIGADEYAEYLNTGDTYAPTVIYWRGNYRVQSIGDFIERSRVMFK